MFEGVGLFVFSDPGAAKAVLAQAKKLQGTLPRIHLVSDREYAFVEIFDLTVEHPSESPMQVLNSIKPDFVFTGTSYTSKIELSYLQAARKMGIKTYSFIDHWTSMKERFIDDGNLILPDKILVIDEEAQNNAIENDIDEGLVQVFGNPYYDFLKTWKPNLSKNDLLNRLGIRDSQKKLVVYAPDPISNANGKERWGFDETEATSAISALLDRNSLNIDFVLKLHPNQKDHVLDVAGKKIVIANADIDSNLLIYYADLVVGFFSNFLIEATIMGKSVIRVYVNSFRNDPLEGKEIGDLLNIEGLEQELIRRYGK